MHSTDPIGTTDRATRRRVVVAMSGGVDSSVAAALLARQGHDVVGITLQLYDAGRASGSKGACCAGKDIHDARRVAEAIGIPHYVLDYEKRFSEAVIGAFAESYIAGETPIPCVTCNQRIKFLDLLETSRELGASALATGHYIQRRDGPAGPALHRAADADRDQSYFLFTTTRSQLSDLWFPLGAMTKPEVRALARDWNLPVAEKADSQDICFVPQGRYASVIEKLKPGAMRPGDIVHVDGRVLGRHDGVVNFTVGQRRGLGIPSDSPLYVIRIDPERNWVVVGPRDFLRTVGVLLKNVNWLGDQPLGSTGTGEVRAFVRIRSTGSLQPAVLCPEGADRVRVVFEHVEFGVAAGQACVFYENDEPQARVLGGGWIERAVQETLPDALSSNEAARKNIRTADADVTAIRS